MECALSREEAGQNQELERLDRTLLDWNGWWRMVQNRKTPTTGVAFSGQSGADRGPCRCLWPPRRILRQVAGFEMDRLTPFTADQVYYDADRAGAPARTAPFAGRVDRIAAGLRGADSAPVAAARACSRMCWMWPAADPDLNLLPPEQRVRRGLGAPDAGDGDRRSVAAGRGGGDLADLAASAQLLIGERQEPTGSKRPRIKPWLCAISSIGPWKPPGCWPGKNRALPPRVDLLRELTAILPDDTWLERLQIKGDNLQIVGQSAKASALVGIVEASKFLKGRFHVAGHHRPALWQGAFHVERPDWRGAVMVASPVPSLGPSRGGVAAAVAGGRR
jgi:general secretion pathway protein L